MTELRKYLRDKNGNPRGLLIATDAGQVGWSAVHPRDTFNKELGLRIARGRAEADRPQPGSIPSKYLGEYQVMEGRSLRYFK